MGLKPQFSRDYLFSAMGHPFQQFAEMMSCVENYRAAVGWNHFTNFKGIYSISCSSGNPWAIDLFPGGKTG